MKHSATVLATVFFTGLAAVAMANPPGDIDGRNIPTDFGPANLVATQANWTGFGDTELVFVSAGSEMDQLFVGKDGAGNLIVSISGNLETNGNAFLIFLDTINTNGQNPLKTELVGGPPYAVQNLGQLTMINTNGTPGVPGDDELERIEDALGLTFDAGFAPDWVIAVDLYSAIGYANLYKLNNTAFPETFDDSSTTIVETLGLYARRCYLGQFVLNTGDGTVTGGGAGSPDNACELLTVDGANWDIAFLDLNTNGVLGVGDLPTVGDAATATMGLEIVIPLTELGMTGSEEIMAQAMLTSGGGGVSNQNLPGLGVGLTKDLSWETDRYPQPNFATTNGTVDFATIDLATQATMATPTVDGDLTDTGYAGISQALQDAATGYGDQKDEPSNTNVIPRSELDQLFVTSDLTNLYLGITGNLEMNGNRLVMFFDTIDGGVRELATDLIDDWGVIEAMDDDLLPLAADNSEVYYDFAMEMKRENDVWYVDLYDLSTNGPEAKTYIGAFQHNTLNGDPVYVGVDDPCLKVALYNDNTYGVIGCGDPTDPSGCFFDMVSTVQAQAATATMGWEMSLPWYLLGIEEMSVDTTDMNFWSLITGGAWDDGGRRVTWRSNQSLPTLRDTTNEFTSQMVNGGNVPGTDYSIAFSGSPDPLPERNFAARTGPFTAPDGCLADCVAFDFDADQDVDLRDFAVFQQCFGVYDGTAPAMCRLADYDCDDDIDLDDYAVFEIFLNP